LEKARHEFGNSPYHLVTNKPVQQYEYITALAAQETDEYNDQEYAWVSAFAGHSYKFVKRLTKDERKNWGYAGIWEISTVRANKDHPAMFLSSCRGDALKCILTVAVWYLNLSRVVERRSSPVNRPNAGALRWRFRGLL